MSHPHRRISRSRGHQAAAATFFLLLATTPAFAGDRQLREKKARTACLNGEFGTGVAILSELFVATEDPTYIFNQGRCFEQNQRYEDAIGRFEEFLQVAETSPAGLAAEHKAAAEKHIEKSKRLLSEKLIREQSKKTSPAPTPERPGQPSRVIAPEMSPSRQAVPAPLVPVYAEPQNSSHGAGAGLRFAGIVTASLGAAGVVAGIVFNLRANSIINDFETKPGSYTPNQDSSRKTYGTLAWVSYGVGAACITTGAVLFGIGLQAGKRNSTEMALMPTVGSGHAGVFLTGGF